MTDRTIFIRENGRSSARGLDQAKDESWLARHTDGDALSYTLDFSGWLQSGETISSVTRGASGPTVSGTSNTTTTVTQKLSGSGYVDITIVTSAGQTKTERVILRELCAETERYPS